SRATVTSATSDEPAVVLAEGSELAFVDVEGAAGIGVAVRAASATLTDVRVTGARSAALAVLCREACDGGTVILTDVVLDKSGLGLWASGARVTMTRGRSAEHDSASLTAAAGVVAQDGAELTLDG